MEMNLQGHRVVTVSGTENLTLRHRLIVPVEIREESV